MRTFSKILLATLSLLALHAPSAAADAEPHAPTATIMLDCWTGSWSLSGSNTIEGDWLLRLVWGDATGTHQDVAAAYGYSHSSAGTAGPSNHYMDGYVYFNGVLVDYSGCR